jgi:hypothetical protein
MLETGHSFRILCGFEKTELIEQSSNHKLLARVLVLEVGGTCGLPRDVFSLNFAESADQVRDLMSAQWCC